MDIQIEHVVGRLAVVFVVLGLFLGYTEVESYEDTSEVQQAELPSAAEPEQDAGAVQEVAKVPLYEL